ncbi:MAG: hypothetical protein IJ834_05740 [Paludibacteraceae bacterium]|nr:hypothetical protein [Paludibacteraceae bacterium]
MKRFFLFSIILIIPLFCSAQLRIWANGKSDKPDFEMMPQQIDSITFKENETNPDKPDTPDQPDQPDQYPTVQTKDGFYTLAFHITASTCNTMVWVGTYNCWSVDNVSDLIKLTPISGYDEWWQCQVPATADCEYEVPIQKGKLVMLTKDGKFQWANQAGSTQCWKILSGDAQFEVEGAPETQFNLGDPSKPIFLELSAWQYDICQEIEVPDDNKFLVTFYPPTPSCDITITPAVIGAFNNWDISEGYVVMTKVNDHYEAQVEADAGSTFKIFDAQYKWSNEVIYNGMALPNERFDTNPKILNFNTDDYDWSGCYYLP